MSEDCKYLLRFPPYRSQSWIEENRSLKAVNPSLSDVVLQPKGLLNYSHVKAYNIKADSVRQEIRNALFRQALFKIQNIEVLSYKTCKSDRILTNIYKNENPFRLPNFLRINNDKYLISEETWTVDRCGVDQKYRVRFFKEGPDGFKWFLKKLLSNKTDENEDSFTSAHLGEENNFYYNDELKQWVIRGEEDKVRETLNTSPPLMAGNNSDFNAPLPPSQQSNGNNSGDPSSEPCDFNPHSSNPLGRRVLRSSQLYTNIPGMNVFETKPTKEPFLNIPASSSQFIPSKDDFDASLVNDAYADLMKPTALNPEKLTEETQ